MTDEDRCDVDRCWCRSRFPYPPGPPSGPPRGHDPRGRLMRWSPTMPALRFLPPTATGLAGPLTERAIHEVSVVRSDLERLDDAGTGLLDRDRVLEVLRDHHDRLRDELVDDETRAELEARQAAR